MTLKRDKLIAEARERYDYAREAWGEIYRQCRDDLNFSDPTHPDQWPDQVRREREQAKRPCMTFDMLGQFARQVVNTARRNKPAIRYIPVDDQSDLEVAEVLQGLARQTEYASRADVAYITALDHATRGGLGYFRAVLEDDPMAPVIGQKCVKIVRVVDIETVLPDPDFTHPDGSDMQWALIEQQVSRKKFERDFPKAKQVDFASDEGGWWTKDHVRLCEYFRLKEKVENVLSVGGQEMTEDEYWQQVQTTGQRLPAIPNTKRTTVCEHFLISGEEILEQTEFPAEYIPVFPVIGNESWEDGKRRLGGCVRTARDAQVAYNLERNSEMEAVAMGPKAPWLAPAESIEGLEAWWKQANSGNLAYLPFNTIDEQGKPIPHKPERIQPAQIVTGWAALREASKTDIQSALGMYQAAVGNNPNSQSGRAVLAIQDRADVSSYHYIDNLALSISHCGRVLTQVWPRIYDQEQVVRILGEDDEASFVRVVPDMPRGYAEMPGPNGQKQILVNPNVGRYDVRVTVGPAYMTRQTEAAAELSELVNGNPQMLALLGDVWVELRGFPKADKIAKRLKALLPPQVQAVEQQEEGGPPPLPPQVEQAMQQAAERIQQLEAALQQAQSGLAVEQLRAQTTLAKAQIDSDTKRDIEELKGVVQMLIQQMQPPPMLAQNVADDLTQ